MTSSLFAWIKYRSTFLRSWIGTFWNICRGSLQIFRKLILFYFFWFPGLSTTCSSSCRSCMASWGRAAWSACWAEPTSSRTFSCSWRPPASSRWSATGIIPRVFDSTLLFLSPRDWALMCSPVFAPRDEGKQRVCLDIIHKIIALLTPVQLQELLGSVTAFTSHPSPVCRERMYDILMWIQDNYRCWTQPSILRCCDSGCFYIRAVEVNAFTQTPIYI